MKRSMLRNNPFATCLYIFSCMILFACSTMPTSKVLPDSHQSVQPAAQSTQPGPAFAGGREDVFEVTAWLDNPTPTRGEKILLSGSLNKNGVYLGGMMMEANWPGQAQDRGEPSCFVLVIYQRGICYIDTKDFQVDETVTARVKFRYNEEVYTGEASFTVK